MLPIEAALSIVGEKIKWRPGQSVYDLLFSVVDFNHDCLFDAIGSLLLRLKDEVKQDIIYRFVREEKFVELAALFFADNKRPSNSIHLPTEVFVKLRTTFSEEIISLTEEEVEFAINENDNGNGKLAATMRRKKTLMITLQLLEFFYRVDLRIPEHGAGFLAIRDKDGVFRVVSRKRVDKLARNVVEAGYRLTDHDLPKLGDILAREKGTRVLLPKRISTYDRKDMIPSYLQPQALFHTMPRRMRINQEDPRLGLPSFGRRGLSSAVQGFRTAHGFKSGFGTMFFNPVDAQSQLAKATHTKDLHVMNSSLNKKLSVFVGIIRRIMRA